MAPAAVPKKGAKPAKAAKKKKADEDEDEPSAPAGPLSAEAEEGPLHEMFHRLQHDGDDLRLAVL